MLFSEIRQQLNLHIIESTISSENYVSANFFVNSSTAFENVLYYPVEETVIDDDIHSFLFINHLPQGNYKKYALIKSEENPLHLLSKIQNLFISSFNHSNDIAKLASVANSTNSVENLIKMAAGIINNPIVLCTTTYDILYAWDNNQDITDSFWSRYVKNSTITSDLVNFYEKSNITKRVKLRNEPLMWNYNDHFDFPNPHNILTQRIMGKRGVIAYISCLLLTENSTTISIEILKQLSEILSKLLSDNSVSISSSLYAKKLFLQHLINGEFMDQDNLDFQLENISFQRKNYYRLIWVSSENDTPIYNIDHYLSRIDTSNIIGTNYNSNMILLITYDHNFKKIIDFIDQSFDMDQFRYFVSAEFENILHAEMLIKTMNGQFPSNKKINYLEDYLLLKHVPLSYLYNGTYELLLNRPGGMEMIKTLAVYIENNMNITDCAKALYIHRNTTMHRLERIRIEGNIDIDNYLELMNFYIYYCVKNDLL